ncbi:RecB family exonuclease [candidate division KSB1 bacterium]
MKNHNEKDISLVLSFTQIETYQRCPLLYKFRYIFKVRAPLSSAPTFGQIIHRTLHQFYGMIAEKKEISKKILLDIFEKFWVSGGFEDELQERSFKLKGQKQLSEYFDLNESSFKPALFLEKDFYFTIDNIAITGRFDRIDSCGADRIEIIDYKTGKEKPQRDADKSIQMSIYAAAAKEFVPNKEIDSLTFYYLETNKAVKTSRTNEEIEDTLAAIKETAENINARNFDPQEGHHCNWCAYQWICPAKQLQ